MPLDIQLFRNNVEVIKESQLKREKDPALVQRVLELDELVRQSRSRSDLLNGAKNTVSKEFGKKKKAKEADGETDDVPEEIVAGLPELNGEALSALCLRQLKALGTVITEKKEAAAQEADNLEKERATAIGKVGNLLYHKVAPGKNEEANPVVSTWGDDKVEASKGEGFKRISHVDLTMRMGLNCGEKESGISGGRAYFLKGPLVRLQLALAQFAISFLGNEERGFTPVYPPFFMNQSQMGAVAELEDFDEQLYKIEGGEGEDKYLIATSEQPLCAMHSKQYYSDKQLPLKYVGWSTCFRKEAGSHGRDTLGMYRVHQFEKIEQFVVCSPNPAPVAEGETPNEEPQSWKYMDELINNAKAFYEALEIPYRVVGIVGGALNGAAAMKYDLEGWFPASGEYRELVSCSNCTDYQSRALDARFGAGTAKGGKGGAQDKGEKQYVHMINSTLCAITRVVCALCENHHTEEGIRIPPALQPYLGGDKLLKFVNK